VPRLLEETSVAAADEVVHRNQQGDAQFAGQ
jgi:hypothetical protein